MTHGTDHGVVLAIPEVTADDIQWAADLMQLGPIDEQRETFLRSRETIDVAACPGSGKTTLVVAKLAILGRKWPHRTRGICVLSHTNVAREEIQRRLGSSVVGQRVLGYPHFIDTIHGFINRFLGLPWLNSNGYPPATIDDDLTHVIRRRALSFAEAKTLHFVLNKHHKDLSQLRISDRNLSFTLHGGPFPAGDHTDSFKFARKAVELTARSGYFCYDEMFIWARALLDDAPDVAKWLRHRFPLVLLDEMQDTNDLQSDLLRRVFPRTSEDTAVQRIGDPNQAIFDDSDEEAEPTETFPDEGRCVEISNSYRFGPNLGHLASGFAVRPVQPNGLVGIGPATSVIASEGRHALLVFPNETTANVLDAYGKYVLDTFPDEVIERSIVSAVGAVHQDAMDVPPGHSHYPKTVSHYWHHYSPALGRNEKHPKTLIDYFKSAQHHVASSHDCWMGVETVAAGFVRLCRLVGKLTELRRNRRRHRELEVTMAHNQEALAAYRDLIRFFVIDLADITQSRWADAQENIKRVVRSLCVGPTVNAEAVDFLRWSSAIQPNALPEKRQPANIYSVTSGGRAVSIKLGSIHSVKGQTHLATLMLSTFWYGHSSEELMDWLTGESKNSGQTGARNRRRLLQAYVAMTRPSHLLCVAIRRSAMGQTPEAIAAHMNLLQAHGWRIAEILNGEADWIEE